MFLVKALKLLFAEVVDSEQEKTLLFFRKGDQGAVLSGEGEAIAVVGPY